MTTGYAASCPLVRAYCLSAFGCSSGTFSKQNAAFLVCKALGEPKASANGTCLRYHTTKVKTQQDSHVLMCPLPFLYRRKWKSTSLFIGPLETLLSWSSRNFTFARIHAKISAEHLIPRSMVPGGPTGKNMKQCGTNMNKIWTNCKSKLRDQARLGSSQRNAQTLCFSNEHTLLLRQDAGGSLKCLE